MPKYAFAHPGKIGDALYSLPTIKYLCDRDNATADFYTSEYCNPVISLFEYQSYIDKVIIPSGYKMQRMDCGVQPWSMPIPEGVYDATFQLGFRIAPSKALHLWIGESAGLPSVPYPEYQYPNITFFNEPYIVISTKYPTGYNKAFEAFINVCPILTVQVGSPTEFLESKSANFTHLNMLETVSLLSKTKGFLGLPFSQLVLANGFPDIPKVAMHNSATWDMRHVIQRPNNYYPMNPNTDEILKLLKLTQ